MSFAAVVAAPAARSRIPTRGCGRSRPQESHLFFGRDQQVAELVARLERNRFLAVVGVSGSGKSSLVRAGLIPALERGGVLEAGRRWRMVVTRPGRRPVRAAGRRSGEGRPRRLAADAKQPRPDRSRAQLPADESLLVVVDQFEELFRYKDLAGDDRRRAAPTRRVRAEAAEFVQLLLEASRHYPPVYIVLTMRSDYLGDCAEFRDLPETLNDCQYLIPRMTRAAAEGSDRRAARAASRSRRAWCSAC